MPSLKSQFPTAVLPAVRTGIRCVRWHSTNYHRKSYTVILEVLKEPGGALVWRIDESKRKRHKVSNAENIARRRAGASGIPHIPSVHDGMPLSVGHMPVVASTSAADPRPLQASAGANSLRVVVSCLGVPLTASMVIRDRPWKHKPWRDPVDMYLSGTITKQELREQFGFMS